MSRLDDLDDAIESFEDEDDFKVYKAEYEETDAFKVYGMVPSSRHRAEPRDHRVRGVSGLR